MPKTGRRSPKNAPALDFTHLFTGVVPVVPASEDYLAKLNGGWLMLGNDVAGDCVPVTWANFRRLMGAKYPTQDQVWALYKTQNPGFDPNGTADTNGPGSSHDQGMDIQTLLEYLTATGGPDGVKLVCFGKIGLNKSALDAALAIFGGIWTGINVLDINQTQFSQGQPWDYSPTSPDDGGHSVLSGGYTPGTKFITWAAETDFTDSFLTHQVEELWICVWPEHLGSKAFLEGVDQAQLAADYLALTGRPFPVQPTPQPPSPVPVPPAPVVDADHVFMNTATWCTKRSKPYRVWKSAKGYTAS